MFSTPPWRRPGNCGNPATASMVEWCRMRECPDMSRFIHFPLLTPGKQGTQNLYPSYRKNAHEWTWFDSHCMMLYGPLRVFWCTDKCLNLTNNQRWKHSGSTSSHKFEVANHVVSVPAYCAATGCFRCIDISKSISEGVSSLWSSLIQFDPNIYFSQFFSL